MFSAMSGTSERMSTIPASAMVFAGEIWGGASALAAAAIVASAKAITHATCLERILKCNEPLSLRERRREAPSAQRWGEGSKMKECRDIAEPSPALRVALRARPLAASPEGRGVLKPVLFTGTLPREIEILVVVAEIRSRIDLGHVQRAAGLGREIQPGLCIAVEPVHEVLVSRAHDFAGEVAGFLRGKLHGVAARAEARLAEPWIAPYAEFALQFGRRGGLARRRVGYPRDATLLIGALQLV